MCNYPAVLTEADLEDGIPPYHVEEGLNTPICDFEDVLTRLQKEISKQHTERILGQWLVVSNFYRSNFLVIF